MDSQDEAFRAVTRIVSLAANRRYVWRGCPDSALRLRSSLLRELIVAEGEPLPNEQLVRQHEVALLRAAREWGLARETGLPASDLQLLVHLQEHGLPTRLLDVTHDPMTALWFACESGDDRAGVLVAVDVTAAPTHDTVDPQGRTLRQVLRESAVRGAPFLVRPTVPSARSAAQQGLYLSGVVPTGESTGGVDGLPLRLGTPPGRDELGVLFGEPARRAGRPTRLPLCALVVPARLKSTIRSHLTALNRSRAVLFPDADGFRDAYRGEHLQLHPLPDVVPAQDDTEAGS